MAEAESLSAANPEPGMTQSMARIATPGAENHLMIRSSSRLSCQLPVLRSQLGKTSLRWQRATGNRQLLRKGLGVTRGEGSIRLQRRRVGMSPAGLTAEA